MASEKGIVVVTGGSGFVGSALVSDLLEAGYTVRASVRSLSDSTKVSHLLKLQEQHGAERLSLFEADLLIDGSFTESIRGSSAVFHTASPFQLVVEDPQRDLVDPAVKGTTNVLHSCAAAGVARVIVTSSVAAVSVSQPPTPEHVFTEADWNNESTLELSPYRYSKTLAEQTAWRLAAEHQLQLTTICPSFIIGAPLSARVDSTSVRFFLEALRGNVTLNITLGTVALHDVTQAHILALQNPASLGKRFLVTSENLYHSSELLQVIKDHPSFAAYPIKVDPAPAKPAYTLSHQQAKTVLGLNFTPINQAIIEAAEAIVRLGLVEKPQ